MKKYIFIIAAIIGLIAGCYYEYSQVAKYKELYSISTANIKAYESDLINNQEVARVYQNTIDELRQSSDSLTQELLKVQKDRKIKDGQVESLYYQLSKATKVDTVKFEVPVFRDSISVDTIIKDKWYQLDLKLRTPSTLVVEPMFSSERYVIISSKKETINPPSKIFFIRWFQKKHTVITVDVEEKNPYIDIDKQKFIKIVK